MHTSGLLWDRDAERESGDLPHALFVHIRTPETFTLYAGLGNQRRTFCEAMGEVRARAATGTKELHDKLCAYCSSTGQLREKQVGDVIAEPKLKRGRVNMTKSVIRSPLRSR